MFKKVLGTIKNYFSPKLMLSNEEYAELYLDKHKKQINGVIISNVICIFLILFLVISDFENISKEKGDTIYLYYYKVIVLATIVLSIIIATVAIWMRKTNNYPTVLVKFILYSSIFIYTTFNLFATILGRGLQGAELVGIHLAISLFATIYYLNRFERLVYLTLASIAFYFSIKGLIKNPFIFEDTIKNFITACVLFYIIGDFIYTLWIGNIEKYFSNIKKIDQLNEKNKQQENTFKALSLALSQYDNDSSKALAEKAIHLNIEERTHLLLEEFSNTQNLFKTTFQKYQDIFSNVNDGILILDKKGVVIDANKAGLEI